MSIRKKFLQAQGISENILSELPRIARKIRKPEIFIKVLNIERTIAGVLFQSRLVVTYRGYCRDFGTAASGSMERKIVDPPAFSNYLNLTRNPGELVRLVEGIDQDFRDHPEVPGGVGGREAWINYLNEKLRQLRQVLKDIRATLDRKTFNDIRSMLASPWQLPRDIERLYSSHEIKPLSLGFGQDGALHRTRLADAAAASGQITVIFRWYLHMEASGGGWTGEGYVDLGHWPIDDLNGLQQVVGFLFEKGPIQSAVRPSLILIETAVTKCDDAGNVLDDDLEVSILWEDANKTSLGRKGSGWIYGKEPNFWGSYYKFVDYGTDYDAQKADNVTLVLKTEKSAGDRFKKVLILDADGVLWEGVIGEDGPLNVRISPERKAFQKKVKDLKALGILLAINSKNDPGLVERTLAEHPDMILRPDDFVVIAANWNDKVANMEFIARNLNLGTDSFVFMDDSPHERDLIRTALTEVTTPELPHDLSLWPALLEAIFSDSPVAMTAEDKSRTELYQAMRKREDVRGQFKTLEDWHRSLGMIIWVREDEENRPFLPRLAQLSLRTNQFNLTTNRYNELTIEQKLSEDISKIFSIELIDKTGKHGIVGFMVLEADAAKTNWEIVEFCLSCRAINLTIDRAFLGFVAQRLKQEGAEYLYGRYIPRDRNGRVKDFYAQLGFRELPSESKILRWQAQLATTPLNIPDWFEVKSSTMYQMGVPANLLNLVLVIAGMVLLLLIVVVYQRRLDRRLLHEETKIIHSKEDLLWLIEDIANRLAFVSEERREMALPDLASERLNRFLTEGMYRDPVSLYYRVLGMRDFSDQVRSSSSLNPLTNAREILESLQLSLEARVTPQMQWEEFDTIEEADDLIWTMIARIQPPVKVQTWVQRIHRPSGSKTIFYFRMSHYLLMPQDFRPVILSQRRVWTLTRLSALKVGAFQAEYRPAGWGRVLFEMILRSANGAQLPKLFCYTPTARPMEDEPGDRSESSMLVIGFWSVLGWLAIWAMASFHREDMASGSAGLKAKLKMIETLGVSLKYATDLNKGKAAGEFSHMLDWITEALGIRAGPLPPLRIFVNRIVPKSVEDRPGDESSQRLSFLPFRSLIAINYFCKLQNGSVEPTGEFQIAIDLAQNKDKERFLVEFSQAIDRGLQGKDESRDAAEYIYLDDQFRGFSQSVVWALNSDFWTWVNEWVVVLQTGDYRNGIGGSVDMNVPFTQEQAEDFFKKVRGFAGNLYYMEIGVASADRAIAFMEHLKALSEAAALRQEAGGDVFERLTYLVADHVFSSALDAAKSLKMVIPDAKVEAIQLNAAQPRLGLREHKARTGHDYTGKLHGVYTTNTYDTLPGDKIARFEGKFYRIEARARMRREDAISLAQRFNNLNSGELVSDLQSLSRNGVEPFREKYLRLLSDHTQTELRPRLRRYYEFRKALWDFYGKEEETAGVNRLRVEERYVEVEEQKAFQFLDPDVWTIIKEHFPHVQRTPGEIVGEVLSRYDRNVWMHLNNKALEGFLLALTTLHEKGEIVVVDVWARDLTFYSQRFRGPNKTDGSLYEWLGLLFKAFAEELGFVVEFRSVNVERKKHMSQFVARRAKPAKDTANGPEESSMRFLVFSVSSWIFVGVLALALAGGGKEQDRRDGKIREYNGFAWFDRAQPMIGNEEFAEGKFSELSALADKISGTQNFIFLKTNELKRRDLFAGFQANFDGFPNAFNQNGHQFGLGVTSRKSGDRSNEDMVFVPLNNDGEFMRLISHFNLLTQKKQSFSLLPGIGLPALALALVFGSILQGQHDEESQLLNAVLTRRKQSLDIRHHKFITSEIVEELIEVVDQKNTEGIRILTKSRKLELRKILYKLGIEKYEAVQMIPAFFNDVALILQKRDEALPQPQNIKEAVRQLAESHYAALYESFIQQGKLNFADVKEKIEKLKEFGVDIEHIRSQRRLFAQYLDAAQIDYNEALYLTEVLNRDILVPQGFYVLFVMMGVQAQDRNRMYLMHLGEIQRHQIVQIALNERQALQLSVFYVKWLKFNQKPHGMHIAQRIFYSVDGLAEKLNEFSENLNAFLQFEQDVGRTLVFEDLRNGYRNDPLWKIWMRWAYYNFYLSNPVMAAGGDVLEAFVRNYDFHEASHALFFYLSYGVFDFIEVIESGVQRIVSHIDDNQELDQSLEFQARKIFNEERSVMWRMFRAARTTMDRLGILKAAEETFGPLSSLAEGLTFDTLKGQILWREAYAEDYTIRLHGAHDRGRLVYLSYFAQKLLAAGGHEEDILNPQQLEPLMPRLFEELFKNIGRVRELAWDLRSREFKIQPQGLQLQRLEGHIMVARVVELHDAPNEEVSQMSLFLNGGFFIVLSFLALAASRFAIPAHQPEFQNVRMPFSAWKNLRGVIIQKTFKIFEKNAQQDMQLFASMSWFLLVAIVWAMAKQEESAKLANGQYFFGIYNLAAQFGLTNRIYLVENLRDVVKIFGKAEHFTEDGPWSVESDETSQALVAGLDASGMLALVVWVAVAAQARNIGVAGATGWVGSQTIKGFIRSPGFQIDAYVRPQSRKKAAVVLPHSAAIKIRIASLLDLTAMEAWVKNNDVLLDFAAASIVPFNVNLPDEIKFEIFALNVLAPYYRSEFLKLFPEKRLIFPSSSTVYRYHHPQIIEGWIKEDELELSRTIEDYVQMAFVEFGEYVRDVLAKQRPQEDEKFVADFLKKHPLPGEVLDLYALTKLIVERQVLTHSNSVILRFPEAYGPGELTLKAIPKIFRAFVEGWSQVDVRDDVKQYIPIRDVVRVAQAAALIDWRAVPAHQRIINVPGPELLDTWTEVAPAIRQLIKSDVRFNKRTREPIQFIRQTGKPNLPMNGSRLEKQFGFSPDPFTHHQKGLADTFAWWLTWEQEEIQRFLSQMAGVIKTKINADQRLHFSAVDFAAWVLVTALVGWLMKTWFLTAHGIRGRPAFLRGLLLTLVLGIFQPSVPNSIFTTRAFAQTSPTLSFQTSTHLLIYPYLLRQDLEDLPTSARRMVDDALLELLQLNSVGNKAVKESLGRFNRRLFDEFGYVVLPNYDTVINEGIVLRFALYRLDLDGVEYYQLNHLGLQLTARVFPAQIAGKNSELFESKSAFIPEGLENVVARVDAHILALRESLKEDRMSLPDEFERQLLRDYLGGRTDDDILAGLLSRVTYRELIRIWLNFISQGMPPSSRNGEIPPDLAQIASSGKYAYFELYMMAKKLGTTALTQEHGLVDTLFKDYATSAQTDLQQNKPLGDELRKLAETDRPLTQDQALRILRILKESGLFPPERITTEKFELYTLNFGDIPDIMSVMNPASEDLPWKRIGGTVLVGVILGTGVMLVLKKRKGRGNSPGQASLSIIAVPAAVFVFLLLSNLLVAMVRPVEPTAIWVFDPHLPQRNRARWHKFKLTELEVEAEEIKDEITRAVYRVIRQHQIYYSEAAVTIVLDDVYGYVIGMSPNRDNDVIAVMQQRFDRISLERAPYKRGTNNDANDRREANEFLQWIEEWQQWNAQHGDQSTRVYFFNPVVWHHEMTAASASKMFYLISADRDGQEHLEGWLVYERMPGWGLEITYRESAPWNRTKFRKLSGIGTALVKRVMEESASLGYNGRVVANPERIEQEAYYKRLGAVILEVLLPWGKPPDVLKHAFWTPQRSAQLIRGQRPFVVEVQRRHMDRELERLFLDVTAMFKEGYSSEKIWETIHRRLRKFMNWDPILLDKELQREHPWEYRVFLEHGGQTFLEELYRSINDRLSRRAPGDRHSLIGVSDGISVSLMIVGILFVAMVKQSSSSLQRIKVLATDDPLTQKRIENWNAATLITPVSRSKQKLHLGFIPLNIQSTWEDAVDLRCHPASFFSAEEDVRDLLRGPTEIPKVVRRIHPDKIRQKHLLGVLRYYTRQAWRMQQQSSFPINVVNESILRDLLSKPDGIRQLVRRVHPYTLQVLSQPQHYSHHFRFHQGAYYTLFAARLMGALLKPAILINFDSHKDIYFNYTETTIQDYNWAAQALTDGLVEVVINIHHDGTVYVIYKEGDSIEHVLLSEWMIDRSRVEKAQVWVTVDFDFFSLSDHPEGEPRREFHHPLEETEAIIMRFIIEVLVATGMKPVGMNSALSPDYLHKKGRSRLYQIGLKNLLEHQFAAAFGATDRRVMSSVSEALEILRQMDLSQKMADAVEVNRGLRQMNAEMASISVVYVTIMVMVIFVLQGFNHFVWVALPLMSAEVLTRSHPLADQRRMEIPNPREPTYKFELNQMREKEKETKHLMLVAGFDVIFLTIGAGIFLLMASSSPSSGQVRKSIRAARAARYTSDEIGEVTGFEGTTVRGFLRGQDDAIDPKKWQRFLDAVDHLLTRPSPRVVMDAVQNAVRVLFNEAIQDADTASLRALARNPVVRLDAQQLGDFLNSKNPDRRIGLRPRNLRKLWQGYKTLNLSALEPLEALRGTPFAEQSAQIAATSAADRILLKEFVESWLAETPLTHQHISTVRQSVRRLQEYPLTQVEVNAAKILLSILHGFTDKRIAAAARSERNLVVRIRANQWKEITRVQLKRFVEAMLRLLNEVPPAERHQAAVDALRTLLSEVLEPGYLSREKLFPVNDVNLTQAQKDLLVKALVKLLAGLPSRIQTLQKLLPFYRRVRIVPLVPTEMLVCPYPLMEQAQGEAGRDRRILVGFLEQALQSKSSISWDDYRTAQDTAERLRHNPSLRREVEAFRQPGPKTLRREHKEMARRRVALQAAERDFKRWRRAKSAKQKDAKKRTLASAVRQEEEAQLKILRNHLSTRIRLLIRDVKIRHELTLTQEEEISIITKLNSIRNQDSRERQAEEIIAEAIEDIGKHRRSGNDYFSQMVLFEVMLLVAVVFAIVEQMNASTKRIYLVSNITPEKFEANQRAQSLILPGSGVWGMVALVSVSLMMAKWSGENEFDFETARLKRQRKEYEIERKVKEEYAALSQEEKMQYSSPDDWEEVLIHLRRQNTPEGRDLKEFLGGWKVISGLIYDSSYFKFIIPNPIPVDQDWLPSDLKEFEIDLASVKGDRVRKLISIIQMQMKQQEFPYPLFLLGSSVIGKEEADVDLSLSEQINPYSPDYEPLKLLWGVLKLDLEREGFTIKHEVASAIFGMLYIEYTITKYGRAYHITNDQLYLIVPSEVLEKSNDNKDMREEDTGNTPGTTQHLILPGAGVWGALSLVVLMVVALVFEEGEQDAAQNTRKRDKLPKPEKEHPLYDVGPRARDLYTDIRDLRAKSAHIRPKFFFHFQKPSFESSFDDFEDIFLVRFLHPIKRLREGLRSILPKLGLEDSGDSNNNSHRRLLFNKVVNMIVEWKNDRLKVPHDSGFVNLRFASTGELSQAQYVELIDSLELILPGFEVLNLGMIAGPPAYLPLVPSMTAQFFSLNAGLGMLMSLLNILFSMGLLWCCPQEGLSKLLFNLPEMVRLILFWLRMGLIDMSNLCMLMVLLLQRLFLLSCFCQCRHGQAWICKMRSTMSPLRKGKIFLSVIWVRRMSTPKSQFLFRSVQYLDKFYCWVCFKRPPKLWPLRFHLPKIFKLRVPTWKRFEFFSPYSPWVFWTIPVPQFKLRPITPMRRAYSRLVRAHPKVARPKLRSRTAARLIRRKNGFALCRVCRPKIGNGKIRPRRVRVPFQRRIRIVVRPWVKKNPRMILYKRRAPMNRMPKPIFVKIVRTRQRLSKPLRPIQHRVHLVRSKPALKIPRKISYKRNETMLRFRRIPKPVVMKIVRSRPRIVRPIHRLVPRPRPGALRSGWNPIIRNHASKSPKGKKKVPRPPAGEAGACPWGSIREIRKPLVVMRKRLYGKNRSPSVYQRKELLAFSYPKAEWKPVLDLSSPREKAVLTSTAMLLMEERSIKLPIRLKPEMAALPILSKPTITAKPAQRDRKILQHFRTIQLTADRKPFRFQKIRSARIMSPKIFRSRSPRFAPARAMSWIPRRPMIIFKPVWRMVKEVNKRKWNLFWVHVETGRLLIELNYFKEVLKVGLFWFRYVQQILFAELLYRRAGQMDFLVWLRGAFGQRHLWSTLWRRGLGAEGFFDFNGFLRDARYFRLAGSGRPAFDWMPRVWRLIYWYLQRESFTA